MSPHSNLQSGGSLRIVTGGILRIDTSSLSARWRPMGPTALRHRAWKEPGAHLRSLFSPVTPSPELPARRGVTGGASSLAVVLCAQLMIVLDLTVVNIALPSIAHGLHFSASSLAWVLNAYSLTFGGLLLLGGRAGDILGRRRMFLAGIAIFTAASLAGGLATSAAWLLAARAVQGVGGAIASPAVLATIVSGFPEGRERTRALGVFTAVMMGGASLGLVLGGMITEWASWRWVLFVNVPIGIAVLLAAPADPARVGAPAWPVRPRRRADLDGGHVRARLRVPPRRGRAAGQTGSRWRPSPAAVALLACVPGQRVPQPAADHAAAAVRRSQPVGFVRRAAAAGRGHVRDVLLPDAVRAGGPAVQPAAGGRRVRAADRCAVRRLAPRAATHRAVRAQGADGGRAAAGRRRDDLAVPDHSRYGLRPGDSRTDAAARHRHGHHVRAADDGLARGRPA